MFRMSWRTRRAAWTDNLTRLFHVDVRFYSRSFLLLGTSHVSMVIRGVATTFLMARWLPKETLGEFRYILAIFGVAGMFAMTGMNASIIRAIAKGDNVVAWAALKRILTVAPLGSLLILIAAAERMWHGEPHVAMAMTIGAVAFTPYSASGVYGQILTGQQKIKELTVLAILNNVCYAAVFATIVYFRHDLLSVTLAYFGFDILFRGFLSWRELQRLPRTGELGTHLSLGHHMSAIGIFQSLVAQLDQILIQRFGGYASLASFNIAIVIPEQIKDLVNGISGTLLQRMSTHEHSEARMKAARRHYWWILAGSIGLVASYAAIIPFVLPWLFPQYRDAVLPSIVYMTGLVSIPALMGLYFLQAHHELKRLWHFHVTNAVLQVITNLTLIPFFGGWGAIWSKTITRIACMPLAYPRLSKKSSSERTV
jgi:O-antigen/teichoic acid export membrane protein